MIGTYLERLAAALSFDAVLAREVVREAEDHLRTAVAADPGGGLEAERRAIARFGDPYAIAAKFVVVALTGRMRQAGAALILVVVAVFLAMKARVAWYLLMAGAIADKAPSFADAVLVIDRYAFWLSVLVGTIGWIVLSSRSFPAQLQRAQRRWFRLCLLLSLAGTGALILSVASDGILTALRLAGSGLTATALFPILTMAAEIACAGILARRMRCVMSLAAAFLVP